MRRRLAGLFGMLGVLALLLSGAGDASAWGSGAHAWIADELGKRLPFANLNEIYGINAPDAFNYFFENPTVRGFLYEKTHEDFLPVWRRADDRLSKAAAFGFVAHNGKWGADRTAHLDGLTYGQGKGYVIAKAEALMQSLPLSVITQGAIQLPAGVELELHHTFVESAVDLLVGQYDRALGTKLAVAALTRTAELPRLMAEVYAPHLVATIGMSRTTAERLIVANEAGFRKTMVLYGTMLAQDEATSLRLMAEQLADLAPAFLAGVPHIILPPRDALVGLATYYLNAAIQQCEGDVWRELHATVYFVARQLRRHGIAY
jgi:hypothetical protein